MRKEQPKLDDHYIVNSEFEAMVLTHWLGPFTGGAKRLIPVGLEFTVIADPPEMVAAISVRPVPPERWEAFLVDQQDRSAEKYGGYSHVIPRDQLGAHCSRL
jgi:hypothetical protein